MPPVETRHRCSVLVVEDEAELQALLRVALEGEGYAVTIVSNGREALSRLRSTPHTCMIVLDLGLPVMDGREFRAAQLRDRSLAWIPVIVLSGGVETGRIARELGARAFVRKPVDVDELRGILRRVGCCLARPRPAQPSSARQYSHHPHR